MKLIRDYPALTLAFVGSLTALVIAFGVGLTGTQVGAIMATVTALLGLLTHSVVTPVNGTREKVPT